MDIFRKIILIGLIGLSFILSACQTDDETDTGTEEFIPAFEYGPNAHFHQHEGELEYPVQLYCAEEEELREEGVDMWACRRATASQIAYVNQGNAKKDRFLQACARQTGGSVWCNQLIRPNPSSRNTFACTYGSSQPHQLIHPDESTWDFAFEAVRLVDDLERRGMDVCVIYNWWRPEPYNANVGGAAGRHPYGTSVDVRFCSKSDQNRAHAQLCTWRRQGRLRALGYYASTALHFGVGDRVGNTWGKSCP